MNSERRFEPGHDAPPSHEEEGALSSVEERALEACELEVLASDETLPKEDRELAKQELLKRLSDGEAESAPAESDVRETTRMETAKEPAALPHALALADFTKMHGFRPEGLEEGLAWDARVNKLAKFYETVMAADAVPPPNSEVAAKYRAEDAELMKSELERIVGLGTEIRAEIEKADKEIAQLKMERGYMADNLAHIDTNEPEVENQRAELGLQLVLLADEFSGLSDPVEAGRIDKAMKVEPKWWQTMTKEGKKKAEKFNRLKEMVLATQAGTEDLRNTITENIKTKDAKIAQMKVRRQDLINKGIEYEERYNELKDELSK